MFGFKKIYEKAGELLYRKLALMIRLSHKSQPREFVLTHTVSFPTQFLTLVYERVYV